MTRVKLSAPNASSSASGARSPTSTSTPIHPITAQLVPFASLVATGKANQHNQKEDFYAGPSERRKHLRAGLGQQALCSEQYRRRLFVLLPGLAQSVSAH